MAVFFLFLRNVLLQIEILKIKILEHSDPPTQHFFVHKAFFHSFFCRGKVVLCHPAEWHNQEMNSEAASSGSQLRAAVPPKRAKVERGFQTNRAMQDLYGLEDELERTRRKLDEMTKTKLSTEEDRDMWKRLFEDCSKKQSEEIERLRRDYKEWRALTTAVEKVIPARSVPRGQSPMELLTPQEMSQTTETRLPTATGRVTIPDPSDTLGDPVVEQTVKRLIETAGRLVANKNAQGSG